MRFYLYLTIPVRETRTGAAGQLNSENTNYVDLDNFKQTQN